ncbi:unnamed protein product, partial [Ectocarpus sp. 8 AP-2014]
MLHFFGDDAPLAGIEISDTARGFYNLVPTVMDFVRVPSANTVLCVVCGLWTCTIIGEQCMVVHT